MSATTAAFPRLRDDLVFAPQSGGDGRKSTVVKDPRTGKYFRLGEAEDFIARQFDGETSADAIRQRTEQRFGGELAPESLDAFARTLQRAGLLASADGTKPKIRKRPRVHGSLLRLQVRAFDPDRLFSRMQSSIGWCFSKTTRAAVAAIVVLATATAAFAWGEMAAETLAILRWSTIPLVMATMFVILSAHEFAHGLTCKRFGGEVHEVGFMLMYFQPAFYCDVTDAWLLVERWKRVAVSLAGPVMDLTVWGLATLAWRATDADTTVHHVALVAMASTGLHSLLNLNPFLKLDGYYALSDLLGIPNLRRRAFAHVGAMTKRIVGIDAPVAPDLTPRENRLFLIYGVVASVGTFALLAAVVASAGGSLLDGQAPLLMVLTMALVGVRFRKRLRRLFGGAKAADDDDEDDDGGIVASTSASTAAPQPSPPEAAPPAAPAAVPPRRSRRWRYWKRRAWWLGSAAAALAFIAFGRAPLRIPGPFIALPEHNADVRAEIEGIVEEVLVTEGDSVRAGDVIARLSAREARTLLQTVNADIDQREARFRLLRIGASQENIALARSVVTRAEDALRYAQQRLERSAALADRGMATLAEREAAEEARDRARNDLAESQNRLKVLLAGARPEEFEAARAELARLEAQRRLLTAQLQLVEVRSPASGTVATPARELRELRGQVVAKGALIAKVYELRALIVQIAIPEKEIGDVRVGLPVLLRARAYPGRSFEGTVVSISPAVSGSVRAARDDSPATTSNASAASVVVTTLIDNPELLLKPGMSGQAKILCGWRPVRSLIERRFLRSINLALWAWW